MVRPPPVTNAREVAEEEFRNGAQRASDASAGVERERDEEAGNGGEAADARRDRLNRRRVARVTAHDIHEDRAKHELRKCVARGAHDRHDVRTRNGAHPKRGDEVARSGANTARDNVRFAMPPAQRHTVR